MSGLVRIDHNIRKRIIEYIDFILLKKFLIATIAARFKKSLCTAMAFIHPTKDFYTNEGPLMIAHNVWLYYFTYYKSKYSLQTIWSQIYSYYPHIYTCEIIEDESAFILNLEILSNHGSIHLKSLFDVTVTILGKDLFYTFFETKLWYALENLKYIRSQLDYDFLINGIPDEMYVLKMVERGEDVSVENLYNTIRKELKNRCPFRRVLCNLLPKL